ncbi:hypothetical protein [Rubrivirga sp. IMCC45206]|uniref:hypothetical protein n=1 Tax=Rubrivirga sp. IMCC45206 TaxID=3391614 RepID=UPI00398FC9D8
MGRLTLMLVMAAAISGAVFTISTRGAMSDTDRAHAEGQADVLAREIAEAGQSVALTQMVDDDGFIDPTAALGDAQDYEGGQFQIEYSPGATAPGVPVTEATVRVTGTFGGAIHTVESEYRFDPMDAPGPLWLDVPHVVSTVVGSPTISGTADNHPVHVDRRKHDNLNLEGLVPLAELTANAAAVAAAGGSALAIPEAAAWTGDDGLLEDLNVSDGEDLYQLAVAEMTAADRTLAGDQLVTGTETWGSRRQGDDITHVEGNLTITGRVSGHGALLVNGALSVPAGGTLDWEGLVVVRSDADVLPVSLLGRVTVTGMLVVAHQAFAPGGHLDVSVYRDANGMSPSAPGGDVTGSPWGGGYPFFQHTHAFDITPSATPRGDQVFFREGGANGRHENETRFDAFIDSLDPDELIQIRFANPNEHGFSTFGLDIDGEDPMARGTVQRGFGAFAQATDPTLSKPFRAGDLRDLDLDVRSLRALRQSFDDPAVCASYPVCIGYDWNRLGSLALRVLRASDGARLYEASFYWHMRRDEEEAHEAEEAAWRARIAAGEAFGTTLAMGGDVTLTYDIGEISELSDKLGFDGNEVVLVSSRSHHETAAEGRVPDDENEMVTICHVNGAGTEITRRVNSNSLPSHATHPGDYLGACGAGGGPIGGGGATGGDTGADPGGGLVPICNKPRRGSDDWWDRNVSALELPDHLAHGCLAGTCALNAKSTGDDD